jgi:hypothetical protein
MLRTLQRGVLALMLAGVGAAAAEAQTPPPPGSCNGGPFTLTAGQVKFHVALDDGRLAPSMKVTLRIYDADGTIVASRTVSALGAGKTTTLEFSGSGLFRVQATFDRLLAPGDRRETVSSVELLDSDNFKAVIPVKCLPNHPIVE